MIKKVFIGKRENIGSPTAANEEADYSAVIYPSVEGVKVIPFGVSSIFHTRTDISDPTAQKYDLKVDMLFYNKVNSVGAVMSSIVYLGEPLPSNERGVIEYFPRKIYYNNEFEAGMDLQSNTGFYYFNYLRDHGEHYPCFIGIRENAFDLHGFPSAVESENTPVLDGWYTVVSAAVLTTSVENEEMVLKSGALVKRGDGPIEFATKDRPDFLNDDDWHVLKEFSTEYTTAFYVDNEMKGESFDWDPPFVRQDFMILPRYDNVYKKTLEAYIFDNELNNKHRELKSKYSMISYSASRNDFKRAQYYLQSENLTIITENWI